jgi:hypothetical protein
MEPIEIIGQVSGIIGMILVIMSFQFKSKIGFYISQMSGNLFYTVSFLLLGNVAGALMNFLGILRGFVMMQPAEKRKLWQFILLNVTFIAAAVFAATVGGMGWAALLSFAAQTVGTVCMWYGNDRTIRWGQLLLISPLWMINNTMVSFTIGGILGESFNMVSTIVYLIRMHVEKKKRQRACKTEANDV